jgi:hypothetical protein
MRGILMDQAPDSMRTPSRDPVSKAFPKSIGGGPPRRESPNPTKWFARSSISPFPFPTEGIQLKRRRPGRPCWKMRHRFLSKRQPARLFTWDFVPWRSTADERKSPPLLPLPAIPHPGPRHSRRGLRGGALRLLFARGGQASMPERVVGQPLCIPPVEGARAWLADVCLPLAWPGRHSLSSLGHCLFFCNGPTPRVCNCRVTMVEGFAGWLFLRGA